MTNIEFIIDMLKVVIENPNQDLQQIAQITLNRISNNNREILKKQIASNWSEGNDLTLRKLHGENVIDELKKYNKAHQNLSLLLKLTEAYEHGFIQQIELNVT